VDHIKVVLDKRIPINLIQDVNGQNVIFCKSFRDELFETGNFSTKDKDFVHKYVTENNKKYIITDVTTPDGQTYKNVKFQVILNEKGETPFSTFNPKGETSVADSFKLPEKKQLIVETSKAQVKPAKPLDVSESINKIKQDQEYIRKAKQLEQSLIEEKARLVKERKELEEQKQIVKNERIIEEKINDYKQSLLQEFLNVSEKQENTIKEKLSINLKNFENELDAQKQIHGKDIKIVLEDFNRKNLEKLQKILDTNLKTKQDIIDEKIQDYNDSIQSVFVEQTNEIKKDFNTKIKNIENDSIEKLKIFIEERIDERKTELIELLENKGEDFVSKIVDKSDELKKLFDEKFVLDLQQYKEKLIQEINSTNENIVNEYLEKKKTDVGDEIIKFISKERSSLQKDFNKNVQDLKELLEKTVSELNERTPSLDEKIKLIQEKLDQLPKDGQLLMEAKNDILSLSKKYTDSQVKRVAEDTMGYAKRILDLGGGGGSVATQYANGGTMNGNLNVNGNILSGGVNLLNVFSGGGAKITDFVHLSGDTMSGALSAPALSADIIYARNIALVNLSEPDVTTPNNKLQTTSITVQGNDLTAGGQVPSTVIKGATFFGKADGSLGILTNAHDTWGPYTFEYAGVNFNVTQYNNIYFTAGYFPQLWLDTSGNVGIHTAYPSEKLDVNGNIKATGGDSNQWNNAYTNLVYNSTAYLSGFNSTAITQNSASWKNAYTNLVYNSTAYLSAYDMSLVNSNSANWNTAYTNLVNNSANYLSGASTSYVNTNFVKISGDTMTGTLSVGSGGNLFSPSFATFVKNSSYVALSSTLTDNSLYFNSKATFASPGGFIIKGHSPDYSTSIQNLPGKGTYGMWLQNVDSMDPGTTFVSDGRAQVTHAMSFRAGIDNFTAGSDHNHVQWQGAPSNNTQAWQMTNGGSTSVYGYGYDTYSQRFLVHTLPQYQISTTIAATSGYFDTRNANLVTNTDKVSGVVILLDTTFGAGNYNLITPGSVVGVTLNPGLVGLIAVVYNSQCTQVSSNGGSLSAFQFDFFIGSGSNWVPAQKGIRTVNLQSRTNGGNPGVSLITSQVGSNPSTQYVGITGCYRNMTKHALARFSTSSILSGFKPGSPLTLWIPTAMPSTSPIGTGFITSDKIYTFAQGTFPTGVRTGYFDAYVINVSGADMEFALCNLMDSYGFENRFWPISAAGNAGWLLYGGTQDTVHRPTFGTTGFYFEREPWYFDGTNFLSGGMVKCVGLGNSEVYGDFSYGLGYRGAVLGKKSGTFAGDYNAVYSDNSVALGGEGLISLSSTPYQAVVGKYNNPNNNALFVVGAGGGDTNRVNVLEVNNNGLTVTGNISASGTMFASGGNSNQWNTAYTNLVNNSANYLSGASTSYVNTNFVKLSGDTMTGSLNIIGNLSASAIGYFNHVAAATKSFYIPHPTKPDMHLQYGSLESPYHGIRLTGNGSVKCGDSVVVPLPDYIFSLVHQEGVNIQLTNYQHNKTLFVDDIDVNNNTFTVKCEKKLFDKGEYKFFWSFTAIRKDIPQLQTEI